MFPPAHRTTQTTSPLSLAPYIWICLFGLSVLVSCAPEEEGGPECTSSTECDPGLVCFRGACGTGQEGNTTPGFTSTTGTTGSGSACADAPLPTPGALILNEILAAVPADEAGDANQDGVRDTGEDEFFEFVNVTNEVLRIDGMGIFKNNDEDPLIEVSDVCLQPKQALVIFGGLQEGANPPDLGGAQVIISDKTFGLSNTGATIAVRLEEGAVLYDFSYPSVSNASATLDPQLSNDTNYVSHNEFIFGDLGTSLPYSPGLCANGKTFATNCEEDAPIDPCPGASDPVPGDLIINEILASVPRDLPGDANQDGLRDSADDEFVEIVNISGKTLRVGGVTTVKDGDDKAVIQTKCLPADGVVVIFGGLEDGATPPTFPGAIVEIASSAFGLRDSGGNEFAIRTESGTVLDSITTPNSNGESIVRSPELDPNGVLVGHTELSELFYSPGTCAGGGLISSGCTAVVPGDVGDDDADGGGDDVDGGGDDVDIDTEPDVPPSACDLAPLATTDDLVLNELFTDVPNDETGDANGDGVRDASDDEFVELVNTTGALLRIEGVMIQKDGSTKATLTGCLEAGEAAVIFGGIEDGASLPVQQGVIFSIADSVFSFRNSGGSTVTILAADGVTAIQEFPFPGGSGDSFTRSPELDTASPFLNHSNVAPDGAIFSPGTCADGSPLPDGCISQ